MKIKVSKDGLLKIKKEFDAFSPVSLLGNLSGEPESIEMSTLIEENLFDEEGLTPETKALFTQLNKASKAERTVLLTPLGQIHRVVYTSDGEAPITVNEKEGYFLIESPGEVEKSLNLYMDIFGHSDMVVAKVDYKLQELDALVLAGIMDLRIERGLALLLGEERAPGLKKKDLIRYFGEGLKNNRLAPMVYGLMEADGYSLSEEDLDKSLESLIQEGVIELDGHEIAVIEPVVVLSDNLLAFNSVIKTETYIDGEDYIYGEKAIIVYGGPMAMIMINGSKDGIRLVSITGHTLMELLL